MGFLDFIFGVKKRQIKELLAKDAIILDVRTQMEWDNGHIENAKHIPLDELETRVDELKKLNIKSIAMFYPAHGYEIQLKPKVPVLVMTGGKDKIVKVDDILKHMVAENVTIHVYDDAYHGYDVESLKKGKYYRYIPFISKKHYLLKYDEEAAQESFEELIKFLRKN